MSSMKEIDARNLLCPLPVIRTQDAIKDMENCEEFLVRCTDPGAIHDIPSWCRINGHEVISVNSGDYEIEIRIKVVK